MDRDGLTEILQGRKKAFIVTDRFMHESGKVSYITDICARMGVEVTIFSEIKPDPDIATVTKGISMMVDIKPDVLFALGGGSSIDAAKAMNYLASREGMLEKAYFVAIPTTSGTGSEVTTFAVISDPDKKAKYPLISENMLPDAAVLDAELTKTVPASITADTGIDVLTHAYEAYVSSKANDFTDAAAEKSMKLVFEYLPGSVQSSRKEYRRADERRSVCKTEDASCVLSGRNGIFQCRTWYQSQYGTYPGRTFPYSTRKSQCSASPLCDGIQLWMPYFSHTCGRTLCKDVYGSIT